MNIESNILNKKLELIQWVSSIEDESIIEKILQIRKKEDKDWWDSISENEKDAIESGLKDADAGKLNPHSNAKKLYEKWL